MDIDSGRRAPGVPRDEEQVRRDTEAASVRPPEEGDALDNGSPADPDRPTESVWDGDILREPGPGPVD